MLCISSQRGEFVDTLIFSLKINLKNKSKFEKKINKNKNKSKVKEISKSNNFKKKKSSYPSKKKVQFFNSKEKEILIYPHRLRYFLNTIPFGLLFLRYLMRYYILTITLL